MARGERPPNGYAQSVADLFRTAPEYEAQIADKALDVDELRLLKAWEPALQEIHTLRPSRRLSEALSLVISRRAALMFNEDMLTSKVLTLELKKALTIYPENEHADQSLKDAVKNQEIEELDNLLYRHKMNRACKLARETEYEEVRESFFEFVEGVLDEFEHAASSREESIVILKDLEKWCVRVDPDHDILYDIEEMLEEIEGR